MHLPINVKSPNNISKWHMGFNSAFKGLTLLNSKFTLEVCPSTLDTPCMLRLYYYAVILFKCPAWNFGRRHISYIFRGCLQRDPATSDGQNSVSEPQWPPFPTRTTRKIHTSYVTCPNFRHLTLICKTYETKTFVYAVFIDACTAHSFNYTARDNWLRKAGNGSGNDYGTANITEFLWRKWREARGTYQNIRSLDGDLNTGPYIYTKTGKDTCNWEEKLHIDKTVRNFITKGYRV
jgi:hypothetical protein